jgi:hypothetical protein
MVSSRAPTDTLRSDLVAFTALLTVPLILASYGLARALVSAYEVTVPGITLAFATVLSVSSVLTFARLARRAAPLRWPMVLATVLFVQSFLPCFGTLLTLGEPLVYSFWRCGTEHVLLLAGALLLALGVAPMVFFLARWKALKFGLRCARVLRFLALFVLVAMVIFTTYGAYLMATRPQARAYLRGIPRAGEVPSVVLTPAMPVRFDVAGSVAVWRSCDAHGCDLSLRQPAPSQGESLPRYSIRVGPEALRVRVDAALGLAVFEDLSGHFAGAFHLSAHDPTDITWAMLRGRVAPPRAWLACAGLGFLLAFVAFVRSASDTRALRRWRSARAGVLTAGVVRLDDPPVALIVPDPPPLPGGPVLLFEEASRTPFREASHVSAEALRVGTHTDLETAIAVSESTRSVLAAVIVLWTAIPLALATMVVR